MFKGTVYWFYMGVHGTLAHEYGLLEVFFFIFSSPVAATVDLIVSLIDLKLSNSNRHGVIGPIFETIKIDRSCQKDQENETRLR